MKNKWIIVVAFCGLAFSIPSDAAAPAPQVEPNYASADVVSELMRERPAFAALPQDAQAATYGWLLANCAVGIEERTETLKRLGSADEFALIEAFAMGPPQALLDQLAADSRATYEGVLASVATGEELPFGPDARGAVLALRADEYVGNTLNTTAVNYRRASLSGIELVGSEISLRWLERTIPKLKEKDLRERAEAVRAGLQTRLRSKK